MSDRRDFAVPDSEDRVILDQDDETESSISREIVPWEKGSELSRELAIARPSFYDRFGDRAIPTFTRDFTLPDPIPAEGQKRALAVMESGRLFRYQHPPKNSTLPPSSACPSEEAASFEVEFAEALGVRYAVGLNSGGSAMLLAMKASGVQEGDCVLVNAFTLTPVPSAIVHAGAKPVLVECDSNFHIDLADARKKARSTGARHLLLSHIRGHVANMEAISALCQMEGITLIEDCAHTLGATWNGKAVGTFGSIACFSGQTNKLLNAGEGGILTTDDAEIAARVVLYSGSYGLFEAHKSRPEQVVFDILHDIIPNFSMRMTNLAAAVLRPQLVLLPAKIQLFNRHWRLLADELTRSPHIEIPARDPREGIVGSSIQFSLPRLVYGRIGRVVERCGAHGVNVAWFGRKTWQGFTSTAMHWKYTGCDARTLPKTLRVLSKLCDVPLYHTSTWDDEDFLLVGRIIRMVVDQEAIGGEEALPGPALSSKL